MDINLNNRIVLIVGPSTMGKTTLSKKINKEFPGKSKIISHDSVLETINKNQSQEEIDMQFRVTYINQITEAISDYSNEMIILDTLNFNAKSLASFLLIMRMFANCMDGITLIKMNLPLELHEEYISKRYETNKKMDLTAIASQRNRYTSFNGSLYTSYNGLVNEEIIIENPQNLNLQFNKNVNKIKAKI